jgi:hypothetical protein
VPAARLYALAGCRRYPSEPGLELVEVIPAHRQRSDRRRHITNAGEYGARRDCAELRDLNESETVRITIRPHYGWRGIALQDPFAEVDETATVKVLPRRSGQLVKKSKERCKK